VSHLIVLHPDGRREERPLPEGGTERLRALQDAVGGRIEYVSPAWHALQNWDVVINEDGLGRLPVNAYGSRLVGLYLSQYRPWCGPIVLVPREGAPASEERVAALEFHSRLEAGELPPGVFVIDARD